MSYAEFLAVKAQDEGEYGFDPVFMPEYLFDFQQTLVEWATKKGRAAIFADCGLGKTPMQLVWAENVARKTGGRVLVITPLAVSYQTTQEAAKFHVEAVVSRDGTLTDSAITVTNYERLHYFDSAAFVGVVCDESSTIKAFDGVRRQAVTDFMRRTPYRLLCTATAAPNDYIELGTSSEALSYLGHMDMLSRFFTNKERSMKVRRPSRWNTQRDMDGILLVDGWRFKGHAEHAFWKWVASWARAMRKPSDLGFDDADFVLPALNVCEHIVKARNRREDTLFDLPAIGLREERAEQRRTITERCEMVAQLLDGAGSAVAWCQLNDEGDLLTSMIDGAVQVSGADSLDAKEDKLLAFGRGDVRVLVTKPKIASFGLNWQHCNRMAFFPSHSYEQYYQAVRRSWRFGQLRPVTVDLVTTEGGSAALKNLQRKARQADRMFATLVEYMNEAIAIDRTQRFETPMEAPVWL